ncbi:MAG: gamma carbonic anhydrase family protein [Chloroflexota bacterium]|jgi:carbonic anhydrase/acetyltransferase-like protein (isoleucine patch superfamily)|nr:gamma carbonic anhydrase family protein [Chloroflexota bacterium]MDP6508656.1 gamma carbonic anhydrase family protein [Chloroflexota bacterium]MDP6757530.1 gamma carbonic anhydrase family protein [Chloroflexota bacterium]
MRLIPFRGKSPTVDPEAFIAPGAVLIGDVHIGPGASVWFNAVVRADHEPIYIGANSNIQDGAVVHIDHGIPVHIGENVTIGHAAVVHSATVGDGVLIGMNATVLNSAVIGAGAVVGGNALVTENAEFAPGSLIVGVPAKAIGTVRQQMRAWIVKNCAEYVKLGREYAAAGDEAGG